MALYDDILAAASVIHAGSDPDNGDTNVADDSGNGNNGTRIPSAAGGPQWETIAALGDRYGLRGTGAAGVEIEVNPPTLPLAAFAWFNHDSQLKSFSRVFSIRGSGSKDMSVYLTSLGQVFFRSPAGNVNTASSAVAHSELHHVGIGYDGAKYACFLDGVEVLSPSPIASTAPSLLWGYGLGTVGGNQTFDGIVADLILFDSIPADGITATAAWLANSDNNLLTGEGEGGGSTAFFPQTYLLQGGAL